MLEYFADFLQFRGLGAIKMNPLSGDLLSNWQAFAAAQQEWCHLLKSLQTDPQLETVFGSRLKEPKLEYDSKTARSWIGFYSTVDAPRFYVGVGFLNSKPPALWVEVETSIESGDILRDPQKLSPELQKYWINAKEYSFANDPWANVGNSTKDNIIAAFLQPLTSEFDGNADEIRNWFHEVIKSVAQQIEKAADRT